MGLHYVVNTHPAEECEPMEPAMDRLTPMVKGKDFFCTCPAGVHGFVMFLEAGSAEDVMQGLPAAWRKGTRAIPCEVFKLPV